MSNRVFNKCLMVTFSNGRMESYVLTGENKTVLAKAVENDGGGWTGGEIIGRIPAGLHAVCPDQTGCVINLLRSKGLKIKKWGWATCFQSIKKTERRVIL